MTLLDESEESLGVIAAEDLLLWLEEERGETLYEFTGVAPAESVIDKPVTNVRRRYRWLVLNLGTASLAAAVVGVFESTIAAIAISAAYMPVVAGMGAVPARRPCPSLCAGSRSTRSPSPPASASS